MLLRQSCLLYCQYMSKRALEKSPLFPYVAWTLIVGFTIFVGSLTLELRQTIQEISQTSQTIDLMPSALP
jgi:uncharacterized membrane protein YgdD (TMEM256/DUF423 family)